MGATTVAAKAHGRYNDKKVVEADITFSGSYATAGDTLAVAALGLDRVDEVSVPSHHLVTRKPVATTSSQAGKSFQLGGTSTAPKLLAYDAANTEIANATNLSGVTVRLRFFGK
jgi:hypothetical protein